MKSSNQNASFSLSYEVLEYLTEVAHEEREFQATRFFVSLRILSFEMRKSLVHHFLCTKQNEKCTNNTVGVKVRRWDILPEEAL